jgi:hypothetical protein
MIGGPKALETVGIPARDDPDTRAQSTGKPVKHGSCTSGVIANTA